MIAKTAVLVKHHQAEIHELELGPVGDEQILVKLETCNLCTTDYQQWMGLREHQGYPYAGGHENTGIVVEVGKNVVDIQVGDRVSFGYDFCGQCDPCRKGDTYECKHYNHGGCSEDGYYGFKGLANYKMADARYAIKMNKDINPACAGFVEPLGTVIHGFNKLNMKPNQDLVIVGAGTMGLLNALTARAYGARVIISELMENKIERAKRLGFEVIDAKEKDPVQEVFRLTKNKCADIVIGAVGATKAYDQCLAMLKKNGGKFLVFAAGYPKPELHVDPNDIHYRQTEIIGTFGADMRDFIKAAEFISDGFIDVSGCLEGETYGLKDIQKAYEAASQPGKYRVTVDCQDI